MGLLRRRAHSQLSGEGKNVRRRFYQKLRTSLIDTRRAYEKARDEATEPDLKAYLVEMVSMRQDHRDQLHRVLIEMGEKADDSGSFMTTVHRAVIGVRAAVTGVDHSSLSSFASGEENILKQYDEALEEPDLRPQTISLLSRQRSSVLQRIDQMKKRATS